ncbi:MAG: hypothetical protein EOO23_03915 [Comamonadaceae bacterium]|nr:MAG: hypothetical protein EOO23_03915 [Comamonadaceae bacterium]
MSHTKVYLDQLEDGKDLEWLAQRIRNLIELRLSAGEPVYLSQLGAELGPDKERIHQLSGLKLVDYVQQVLRYKLDRTGAHNNVLYIAPAPDKKVEAAAPKVVAPRSVWLAFTTPIEEGQRRVLDLTTLRFGAPEEFENLEQTREITPEFIAENRAGPQFAKVLEAWLAQADLTLSALQKRDRPLGKTALDSLLESLTSDQLRRVSLPLDIIQTLRDRPLRPS